MLSCRQSKKKSLQISLFLCHVSVDDADDWALNTSTLGIFNRVHERLVLCIYETKDIIRRDKTSPLLLPEIHVLSRVDNLLNMFVKWVERFKNSRSNACGLQFAQSTIRNVVFEHFIEITGRSKDVSSNTTFCTQQKGQIVLLSKKQHVWWYNTDQLYHLLIHSLYLVIS